MAREIMTHKREIARLPTLKRTGKGRRAGIKLVTKNVEKYRKGVRKS